MYMAVYVLWQCSRSLFSVRISMGVLGRAVASTRIVTRETAFGGGPSSSERAVAVPRAVTGHLGFSYRRSIWTGYGRVEHDCTMANLNLRLYYVHSA